MAQPTQPQKPKLPPLPCPAQSLEELAREQGISQPQDLDAISKRWPVDDDPEALDAFVRDQRGWRTLGRSRKLRV